MVWVHPKMTKLASYITGALVGVSSLWPYPTSDHLRFQGGFQLPPPMSFTILQP